MPHLNILSVAHRHWNRGANRQCYSPGGAQGWRGGRSPTSTRRHTGWENASHGTDITEMKCRDKNETVEGKVL